MRLSVMDCPTNCPARQDSQSSGSSRLPFYALVLSAWLASVSAVQSAAITGLAVANEQLDTNSMPVIDVSITNDSGTPIDFFGVTFIVKIGDGLSGPTIQDINLDGTGLLFDTGSQSTVAGGNNWTQGRTAFDANNVTLAGSSTTTLAKITLDTTGVTGSFAVSFQQPNLLNQTTVFAGNSLPTITLNDGMITVVPEPVTYVFSGGLCLALAVGHRIRRQRRASN